MNDKITDELLKMKDRIESAKAEKNRVEGELRQLKARLKDEFGTDDPKQIQINLTGLRQQAAQLREQINEGMEVLRREMRE